MSLDLDGFVTWPDERNLSPVFNVEAFRNHLSPFSNAHELRRAETGTLLIDKYYGYVYDDLAIWPVGLYGESAALPIYPIDLLQNFGFLRVPMRKVPRRIVRSRRELQAIIARIDQDTKVQKRFVFRGQHREYDLGRSSRTREALYGDPEAVEPSLLPSASRRQRSIDTIIADWTHLVRFFMCRHEERVRSWASERTIGEILASNEKLATSRALVTFATALAQHYGMPTCGLDVTTRLDVGVWFALHDFRPAQQGGFALTCETDAEALPVVYMLDVHPIQGYDFANVRPRGWPVGRPERQHSWFMPTAWGFRLNRCATYLIAAFYLDPSGDFGPCPEPSELFPLSERDPFAAFLESVVRAASGELGEFVKEFKWVV